METIFLIASIAIFVYALTRIGKSKSTPTQQQAEQPRTQQQTEQANTQQDLEQTPPLETKSRTNTFKPFTAMEIEPKDKPIGKILARKIYRDTIKKARPDIKPGRLKYLCTHYEDNIENYLACLEMLAPNIELHDIDNELDLLHFDLMDEDDEETPLSAEDLEENKRILKEIKALKAKRKEVMHRMAFFKQKDLRYMLAVDLNQLLAPELFDSAITYEELISAAAQHHASKLHSPRHASKA